jgi:NAD-dependent dihydropyrimidine dehydrogenase PreA subunit
MNETKTAPKTSTSRGYVVINSEECKGCELCIASCPAKVLYLNDRFNTHGYHFSAYQGEGCTGCGICFYNCPEPGAITVFKRWDQITESAHCPVCGSVQKIFPKESDPSVMLCTRCLNPMPTEKTVTIK